MDPRAAATERSEGRSRRPGFFQVTRPDELWHLDMASVWIAEHGWCYRNAAIDCCSRDGTASTSRAFRARSANHGVLHRRGGYRYPESQASIGSWASKLKQRCIRRESSTRLTKPDGNRQLGRPLPPPATHSRLAYRTPREVAATWKDPEDQSIPAT